MICEHLLFHDRRDGRVARNVVTHEVGPVTVGPSEADAPLIVDADAVLTFALALQGFQPIGRKNAQITQHRGVCQHAQLAARHGLDIGRQAPGRHSAPDLFRLLAGKVPDHGQTMTLSV
jgi:hypothetical protein